MKKKLLLFISISLILTQNAVAAQKQEISSEFFKYYMHQLYDNYKQAQLSFSLKKYDIADIYLKHILENINEVGKNIPDKNKDGSPLDKEKFRHRLKDLTGHVADMKSAAEKGGVDAEKSKHLSQTIFNTCMGCHEEVKLKSLNIPSRTTLFGEYMHKVREHMDLAKIYMEEKGSKESVEENLKLINYYFDLLENTFPETGPSGVIMDKGNFDKRLKEVRGINEGMLKNVKEGKPADMETFRDSLNGFCVACHEPERVKK